MQKEQHPQAVALHRMVYLAFDVYALQQCNKQPGGNSRSLSEDLTESEHENHDIDLMVALWPC
jgi:hypothetical protein